MSHIERRANLFYAVLTVPPDVRHIIGKLRFVKSTETGSRLEAGIRAAMLVAGWKAEISKARGTLPDAKATFWESLRRDYINAQDEGTQTAIEDLAKAEALKMADQAEGSVMYRATIGVLPMPIQLAPLVEDWKASLRLAQKTIDQQHRDVKAMAAQFGTIGALQPQKIKAWTDLLIAGGASQATLERMMGGCRSLWRYLQDSGTIPVDTPDPFVGSFRLAKKTAKKVTVQRQAFTPADLAKVYGAAVGQGDQPLADLVALGAYTGARIEELCSLKVVDCADGLLRITDSKTDAGIREVPAHPALMGLLQRLSRAATDGYLIPSTAGGKYGVRSDPLSKRFGRLKTALGFSPGHVFHSIRKTVATQLEQAGVAEGVAADLLGHEKATMSYGLYSSGSSTPQKLAAISKVTYPSQLQRP
ncbi:MAG: tyrosine-type recombinase/integrase [Pseudomonadota bacterium]